MTRTMHTLRSGDPVRSFDVGSLASHPVFHDLLTTIISGALDEVSSLPQVEPDDALAEFKA